MVCSLNVNFELTPVIPVKSPLMVGPGCDVHRVDVRGVLPPSPVWSRPLHLGDALQNSLPGKCCVDLGQV